MVACESPAGSVFRQLSAQVSTAAPPKLLISWLARGVPPLAAQISGLTGPVSTALAGIRAERSHRSNRLARYRHHGFRTVFAGSCRRDPRHAITLNPSRRPDANQRQSPNSKQKPLTPQREPLVVTTTLSTPRPILTADGDEIRQQIHELRRQGLTVGFVPTMGALHEGHLSLIRAARQKCDRVAASIFVNPTQFGPAEDLQQYPRPRKRDLQALHDLQVDLVFLPEEAQIYPPGFSTVVQPPRIAEPLEGLFRPGHFQGVATVVLKLFQILPADWAFFGQKDYQQCLVIRDLVRDLNVPIELQFCPTVRESDGLAMSSRNQYLSDEQRQRAVGLSRALRHARQSYRSGVRDPERLEWQARNVLAEFGIDRIDYVAARDPGTLQPSARLGDEAIMLAAVRVGSTRLIDNLRLD